MYNLLAYIKHLDGKNEAALECLRLAEESVQQEHNGQAEIRSLVTWGNYAWVHYHMGQLSEAQRYVDKVKRTCEKFSNPYSIECPELDSEEGWTRLKCGKHERAKVCFQKALEQKPHNPEFSSGLAIAMYHLDESPPKHFSVKVLTQAMELSPDNHYVKVLLGLALKKMNKEAEGEQFVKEALEKAPCQTDVLRSAANFYRKSDLDKAIELLQRALESTPNNGYVYHHLGFCYRAKIKQLQDTGESETSGGGEKIEELRKSLKDCMDKLREKGLNPLSAYSNLSEFLEEEDYETAVNQEFPHAEREPPHQSYCNLQENHRESEHTTVQQCLEGVPAGKKTNDNEEGKHLIKNRDGNVPPQNAPNSYYLQGLTHKLNGDLLQAAECYEKELGHLLRNAPSGIGDFFLSASEPHDGHEETGRDTGSPTSRELHDV